MTQTDSARLTDAEIEAYRALGRKASPEPWTVDRDEHPVLDGPGYCHVDGWTDHGEDYMNLDPTDAAFIAASRTIGPALAEEVLEWRRLDAEMRDHDYTDVDGGWDAGLGAFVEYSREPAPEMPKRTEPCVLSYRGETWELPVGDVPVTGMIIRWMREVDARTGGTP